MNKIIQGDVKEEINNQKLLFDLTIADPPYYKVVNEKWDRNWNNLDDYLNWNIDWINATYNKMRFGGTFYLFGYFRHVSELVSPLRNMGFTLRQQIIINKGIKSVAGRATKNYKIFPNVTESIFMFIKDPIQKSREILKEAQKQSGLSAKEINDMCGVKSNGGGMWSIYTGKNVCEQLPTEELWNKLQKILNFNFPYKKISQTFNPVMGYTDVWDDIDFYEKNRVHPTQKPKKLIERIVQVSSNSNDNVLDLFSGSGVTSLVAKEMKRNSVGIEKEKKYVTLANKKLNKI